MRTEEREGRRGGREEPFLRGWVRSGEMGMEEGRGAVGPLEIYHDYMFALSICASLFFWAFIASLFRLLTPNLPHGKRELRPVRSTEALLAPHHRPTCSGIIRDALCAGERWHGRHVENFVLKDDQHEAFVYVQGEKKRGEHDGRNEESRDMELASG